MEQKLEMRCEKTFILLKIQSKKLFFTKSSLHKFFFFSKEHAREVSVKFLYKKLFNPLRNEVKHSGLTLIWLCLTKHVK